MELGVAITDNYTANAAYSNYRPKRENSDARLEEFFLGKTVLITGASSGIGKSLALRLSQLGSHLVLVARDFERLEETASEVFEHRLLSSQTIRTFAVDVGDAAAVEQLMQDLHEREEGIDILINNAGFCYSDYLESIPSEVIDELARTNLCGTIHMTRSVLPFFKERGAGHVANVASMAGLISFVGMPVYAATKAAVISFSEGLANELSATPIKISMLLPPDTDTPGLQRENETKPDITKRIGQSAKLMSSEEVAEAFLSGLMYGRLYIIPGLGNRMLSRTIRHLPGLVRFVLRRQVRRFESSRRSLRLVRRPKYHH